jgi:hypothetical protein
VHLPPTCRNNCCYREYASLDAEYHSRTVCAHTIIPFPAEKSAQEFLARIVCCASEDKQVQRDTPQILLPGWPGQQSSCSLSSRASFAAGDLVISSIIAPPGRRNHSAAAPTGARAAAESRAPMKRIARSRSCPVPNPRGGKK